MTRNRPSLRQALALAIAEDRAGQEVFRAAEEPIVAYDLIHIFSLTGASMATVLSGDLYVAKQVIYELNGPFTTKDFDIRPVRRSEVVARKKAARKRRA